jgi:hypothetical protein
VSLHPQVPGRYDMTVKKTKAQNGRCDSPYGE